MRKAKIRMEEMKAKKQISLEREQQLKADVRHVRQYFAARLCKRLLDYYYHNRKDHAAQIKEQENTTTAQTQSKVGGTNIIVPNFIDPARNLMHK